MTKKNSLLSEIFLPQAWSLSGTHNTNMYSVFNSHGYSLCCYWLVWEAAVAYKRPMSYWWIHQMTIEWLRQLTEPKWQKPLSMEILRGISNKIFDNFSTVYSLCKGFFSAPVRWRTQDILIGKLASIYYHVLHFEIYINIQFLMHTSRYKFYNSDVYIKKVYFLVLTW